jgi:CHAT domain-containing protein
MASDAPRARLFLGEDATETRVKSLSREGALRQADTLVFATHGRRATSGGEPYLVLTPPPRGERSERDDGRLTTGEIARDLRLDTKLVVLSGCDTALGDGASAPVLSGLPRAFFYAGARSVLASQWPVEAYATRELMRAFAAPDGAGTAEALRRAQRELLRPGAIGRWLERVGLTEDRSHPIYWAAFVVAGS